jgi:hypothetical protein
MNISTDNTPPARLPQNTQPTAQQAAAQATFGKSLAQAQQYAQQIPAAEEALKQKFREKKETNRVLGVIASEAENPEESIYEIVKNLKTTLKNLAEYERTHLGL